MHVTQVRMVVPASTWRCCTVVTQVAVTSPHNPAEVSEIAACLEETTADRQSVAALPQVDGTLYCYLPLPFTATGLPLHVHASWALQSNRRELWSNIDDARNLVWSPTPSLYSICDKHEQR